MNIFNHSRFIAQCSRLSLCFFMIASIYSTSANAVVSDVVTPSVKGRAYLMGVFPYLAPLKLEKMYAPIAADYTKAIGANVQFMTNSTYKSFMKNLDKQLYDIVFVQPFDYVAIADKYGYRPLATRNKPLPAILVVKSDSNITSVSDLRGKTIALPPAVSAISFLMKNHLKENGIDPNRDIKIMHFRSHDSCMHNVVLKIVDACGTAPPAWRFFQTKMKDALKIIGKTDGIPNSIFAIHPRVPEAVRNKLAQQIATWPKTKHGLKLLKGAKVEKFVPAKDSDYDKVRSMAKEFRK